MNDDAAKRRPRAATFAQDAQRRPPSVAPPPSMPVARVVAVPAMDEATAARRREIRAQADDIQRRTGEARFLDWFDRLYAEAGGDAARIPWADLAPHPLLTDWLARTDAHAGRALDIGCGLGDNAAALAAAGYRVTAFDISPHAVEWAKRRFPQAGVDWRVADLFAPPAEWRAAFDLIHETYTLQSLPPAMRDRAVRRLPELLAPGGLLVLVCRARPADLAPVGPPWPLSFDELRPLRQAGLRLLEHECVALAGNRVIPHFFTLWRKKD